MYGGQTTREYPRLSRCYEVKTDVGPEAYDIKLIMNKDVCDIIRPQWILDSVAKEDLVPLVKKCVFSLMVTFPVRRRDTQVFLSRDNGPQGNR